MDRLWRSRQRRNDSNTVQLPISSDQRPVRNERKKKRSAEKTENERGREGDEDVEKKEMIGNGTS